MKSNPMEQLVVIVGVGFYGPVMAERLAAATCPDTVFGGRLGRYTYWDMDKAIAIADYQKLSSGAPGGIRE